MILNKSLKFALSVFSLCLIMACSKGVDKKQTATTDNSPPMPVKVTELKTQKFTTQLQLSSETEAIQQTTLRSKSGGTIEYIGGKVGDSVQKGDVLIQIDAKLARAQYDAAILQYELAETNFKRQQKLFDNQLISSQNFEQQELTYKTSLAQKDVAQIQYDNAFMKAPFSGYISSVPAKENNLVSVGEPLLSIIDYSSLKVVVGCAQNDIGFLRKGQSVQVTIPSIRKTVRGKLTSVGIQADPVSKTFPVEILIPNPGLKIRSGVIAEVSIVTQSFENALVLRQDQILEKKGKKIVVVYADGKAEFRTVELGERNNRQIQILKGLKAGEKVVVEGHGKLEAKQSITVKAN